MENNIKIEAKSLSNPKVSVIIPCYNAAQFIGESIQSVLNQEYKNFELLAIDDGSIDNSAEIIKSFIDERIKYIFQENSGVSSARNKGISVSKGEYIGFLDADDLFLPENLLEKVTFFENNSDVRFVHSPEILFDSKTSETKEIVSGKKGKVINDLLALRETVVSSPSSVIIHKSLIEETTGFDPNLSTFADWDFWVRIALLTDFGYIEKPLVKYRLHPLQMHNNIDLTEKDMKYGLEKNFQNHVFKSKKQYKQSLSRMYWILGLNHFFHSKRYFKSGLYILFSLLFSPRLFFSEIARKSNLY